MFYLFFDFWFLKSTTSCRVFVFFIADYGVHLQATSSESVYATGVSRQLSQLYVGTALSICSGCLSQ